MEKMRGKKDNIKMRKRDRKGEVVVDVQDPIHEIDDTEDRVDDLEAVLETEDVAIMTVVLEEEEVEGIVVEIVIVIEIEIEIEIVIEIVIEIEIETGIANDIILDHQGHQKIKDIRIEMKVVII